MTSNQDYLDEVLENKIQSPSENNLSDKDISKNSEQPPRPYKPWVDTIDKDEILEYDPSAYDIMQKAFIGWPCLSFDIFPDQLGNKRTEFPHTVYVSGGTQADSPENNKVYLMRWSNLCENKSKSKISDENSNSSEESDSDSSEEESKIPKLEYKYIRHNGCVNRLRICPQSPRLIATSSELKGIFIWDINDNLEKFGCKDQELSYQKSLKFEFDGHEYEGFGLAWNPSKIGQLISADRNGDIYFWLPIEGGWNIKKNQFVGHTDSIEDISWKLLGNCAPYTFATGCVDRNVRIYDTREVDGCGPTLELSNAHDSDINCVSWSPFHENLLLSADDNGFCKVWDTRFNNMPIVKLHWHKKPITSVSWHSDDEATFALSSSDDSISIWDFSVEPEDKLDTFCRASTDSDDFPDQLLFYHLGQSNITEMKFHPQIPGLIISTALDSMNIFKPSNI